MRSAPSGQREITGWIQVLGGSGRFSIDVGEHVGEYGTQSAHRIGVGNGSTRDASRLYTGVYACRIAVSEMQYRKPSHALREKGQVFFGRHLRGRRIDLERIARAEVDLLIPIEIEDAFDVEDVHLTIPSKGDRQWNFANRHIVVQEFVVLPDFVGLERACQEEPLHAVVRIAVMGEEVFDSLVATQREPPVATHARLSCAVASS